MKLKQQVINHYNRIYSRKQHQPANLTSQWARQKEINNILNLVKETDTVLDLGCGNGEVSLLIAKKAKKVIGIDIAEQAIKQAKKNQRKAKINNCCFIQGDIEKIKLASQADFILALGIFEHITNLDVILKKISLQLKPAGRLYFHVWNQESLVFRFKKTFGILNKNKPFKRSFYKQKTVEKIILKNNLSLENSYGQLIAHKFKVINKSLFGWIENLGRKRFIARYLADSLVFIVKRP